MPNGTIEATVGTFLKAITALSTIAGTDIWHVVAAQKGPRATVMFRKTASNNEQSFNGPIADHPVFEIACFAETSQIATQMADAIQAAILAWSGVQSSGVNIRGVFLEGNSEEFDQQVGLYGVVRQYEIFHDP